MKYLHIKFRTSLLVMVISLISFSLTAQTGLRNQGAKIIVEDGAAIIITTDTGQFTNSTANGLHGQVDLSGLIILSGDWVNNATGHHLLYGSTGKLIFNGSAKQYIRGTRTTHFKNIQLRENVEILADYEVTNELDLKSGKLTVGDNDLTIIAGASIVNYDADHYIITGGEGSLVMEITAGGSAVLYPVGTDNSYNPVSLQQASGAATNDFSVRLKDKVYSNGTSGTDLTTSKACVDKTWLIESNAGSIDLTITTQWDAANEVNSFDRSQCYISHYSGGEWDSQILGAASGSGPYSRSRSGITSLSPYAVTGDNNGEGLPVELLTFDATKINEDVELNWQTATERNNYGFVVQKSIDGLHFESIEFVTGAGNSNSIQDYSLTDFFAFAIPSTKVLYYRLQQIDFDGKTSLSKIKAVSQQILNSSEVTISLWPNPTNGKIYIRCENSRVQNIRIYDATGQLIDLKEGNAITMNDLSDYTPGVYYVEIKHSTGIVREKLVKIR